MIDLRSKTILLLLVKGITVHGEGGKKSAGRNVYVLHSCTKVPFRIPNVLKIRGDTFSLSLSQFPGSPGLLVQDFLGILKDIFGQSCQYSDS